jgi:hypothetical protein
VTSAMDAYCRKKHIMEEIEIERKKVNRRIGPNNLQIFQVSTSHQVPGVVYFIDCNN